MVLLTIYDLQIVDQQVLRSQGRRSHFHLVCDSSRNQRIKVSNLGIYVQEW
jgi:hypothetical protein